MLTDFEPTFRDALLGLLPRWMLGVGNIQFVPGSDAGNIQLLDDGTEMLVLQGGEIVVNDLSTPATAGQISADGLNGYRLFGCIGALQDVIGAVYIEDGMRACFPGLGDDYALALQGAQRGIMRGLQETCASYARRLWFYRQSRMRKGLAWPLMEQLQAMLQPYPVRVRVVCGDGDRYTPATRYTLAVNGYLANGDYLAPANLTLATIDRTPEPWYWDDSSGIQRFWVIIEGHPWLRDGTWADAGVWNDFDTVGGTVGGAPLDPLGGDITPTYGSTASVASANAVRSVVYDWTPPHATCAGVILAFSSGDFDSINPNSGTWDRPGDRDPKYVYWDALQQ